MAVDSFTIRTTDPDRADEVLQQTYHPEQPLNYHRTEPAFTFAVSAYQSGPLQAARIRHTMVAVAPLPHVEDLVVGTVFTGRLWYAVGGAMPVTATDGEVVLYPDSWRIRTGWDDLDMATLRVPMAAVQAAANETYGERREELRFVDIEPVSAAAGRSWAALSRTVLRQLGEPGTVLGEPLPRQRLIADLARTALLTFPHTYAEAHYRRGWGSVGPSSLRRAAWFIEEHLEECITLSDIASAVNADPAALRYAFRGAHGVTPMQYLERARLEIAHRELLLGGATEDDSLTDVAARTGFLSQTLFAAAYQRRFGIQPAETLWRARESW